MYKLFTNFDCELTNTQISNFPEYIYINNINNNNYYYSKPTSEPDCSYIFSSSNPNIYTTIPSTISNNIYQTTHTTVFNIITTNTMFIY